MNKSLKRYRKKMYLASPLFSEAELNFNIHLKQILSAYFDVYLPQEDGELMRNLINEGISYEKASKRIFTSDINGIKKCDILLIVLDGRSIDEGAAFELGIAYSLGKECVGLQTDVRRLLPVGNNPMLECALTLILNSLEDLIIWARSHQFANELPFELG